MTVTYVIQYRKESWREGYWEDVRDVSKDSPRARLLKAQAERENAFVRESGIQIRLTERQVTETEITA